MMTTMKLFAPVFGLALLGCTETALRVRLHKAMRAIQRHVRACHPELLELIDVAST